MGQEEQQQNSDTEAGPHERPQLQVGCALLPKKVSRYLTPQMLETAAAAGIHLFQIDATKSLKSQGPFDAIIHKLRPSKAWELNLHEYVAHNPRVKVIDRVDGIRTLQNRATMLSPLSGNGILVESVRRAPHDPRLQVRIRAPAQVELPEGMSLEAATAALGAAGLHPPLLVKPLWTDGREGSHGLAVLHDMAALGPLLQRGDADDTDFRPPYIVQQFVEHGGVLFKVYVLGMRTIVTQRPSLGETHLKLKERQNGLQQLPRISCMRQQASGEVRAVQHSDSATWDGGDESVEAVAVTVDGATATVSGAAPVAAVPGMPPPDWVTNALSCCLRKRLGMQLFNFDLICPEPQLQRAAGGATASGTAPDALAPAAGTDNSNETVYYVVDINYFPGVDKIPGFEQVFVDFLKAACLERQPMQELQPTAVAARV